MNEYIEYEQVVNGARELKSCASKMRIIFDAVTGHMNQMTSSDNFQGRASNRLQEEFNNKRKEFDSYVAAVERFASLFETSSEMLETAEKKIESVANELNTN